MTHKLTILVGPPASGKSTFAKQLESQGAVRISQDDQGRSEHMELFQSHVTTGVDLVIDRMNFDRKQRDKYRLEAVKNGYTINFVEFCVPRQVCFDRCMERQGHPTINGFIPLTGSGAISGMICDTKKRDNAEAALTTFFRFYEPVTAEEGQLEQRFFSVAAKKSAIMVDLDGTIANLNHRLHFVRGPEKKRWDRFFQECGNDELYPCVAGIVKLEQSSGTEIVFCSGRDEVQCRELSHNWLEKHGFAEPNLVMRPKLNYKDDAITKIMLYNYEIKPYYDVKYVLDDRSRVVEAWRKLGLVCLQVRPGDF